MVVATLGPADGYVLGCIDIIELGLEEANLLGWTLRLNDGILLIINVGSFVGVFDGIMLGIDEGILLDKEDGTLLGLLVVTLLGLTDGPVLGINLISLGVDDGYLLDSAVRANDGEVLGIDDGEPLCINVGSFVGKLLSINDGSPVGTEENDVLHFGQVKHCTFLHISDCGITV